jgi:hypothetical protein
MEMRLIKDSAGYDAAMARVEALMERDPAPETAEEEELQLLALLVMDYEHRTVGPIPNPWLDAVLSECMRVVEGGDPEGDPARGKTVGTAPIHVPVANIHAANLYFSWTQESVGCGECHISKNADGTLTASTEYMSREWLRQALHAAADTLADAAQLGE